MSDCSVGHACRMTGFRICTFGPDSEECDSCNAPGRQLYFHSTDPYSHDGDYFCGPCVIQEAESNPRYL